MKFISLCQFFDLSDFNISRSFGVSSHIRQPWQAKLSNCQKETTPRITPKQVILTNNSI